MANKGQAGLQPFKQIETIQLLELSTIVRGPLSGNLPTTLALGYGVNVIPRPDRDTDVVTVPFSFTAVAGAHETGEEPKLEAVCRLIGVWQFPKGFSIEIDALKAMAEVHAIPKLYLLARQHLGDVMSKVGARVEAWSWEAPGAIFATNSTTPIKKRPKSVKSKTRRGRTGK